MSDDLDILAKTVWAEARGEGIAGMAAVACVIRNRATHPRIRWWGVGWQGVCLQPWQFSCWNEGDPNRRALIVGPPPSFSWTLAKQIASEVYSGALPDITGGADHYYNPAAASPGWALTGHPIRVIGRHHFHRLHA